MTCKTYIGLTDLVITPRTAAHLAGMPLRTLRSVAAEMEMFGASERYPGQHRRYCPLDVLRLAVIARLLELGIGVGGAIRFAEAELDRHVFALVKCGVDLPVSMLTHRTAGLVLTYAASLGSPVSINVRVDVIAADIIRACDTRPFNRPPAIEKDICS